jgi:hypothetical protein
VPSSRITPSVLIRARNSLLTSSNSAKPPITCAGTSRNHSCSLSPRASWLRCMSRAARRPDSVCRLIHSLTATYSTSMRSVSPLHSKIAPLPRKGQAECGTERDRATPGLRHPADTRIKAYHATVDCVMNTRWRSPCRASREAVRRTGGLACFIISGGPSGKACARAEHRHRRRYDAKIAPTELRLLK